MMFFVVLKRINVDNDKRFGLKAIMSTTGLSIAWKLVK